MMLSGAFGAASLLLLVSITSLGVNVESCNNGASADSIFEQIKACYNAQPQKDIRDAQVAMLIGSCLSKKKDPEIEKKFLHCVELASHQFVNAFVACGMKFEKYYGKSYFHLVADPGILYEDYKCAVRKMTFKHGMNNLKDRVAVGCLYTLAKELCYHPHKFSTGSGPYGPGAGWFPGGPMWQQGDDGESGWQGGWPYGGMYDINWGDDMDTDEDAGSGIVPVTKTAGHGPKNVHDGGTSDSGTAAGAAAAAGSSSDGNGESNSAAVAAAAAAAENSEGVSSSSAGAAATSSGGDSAVAASTAAAANEGGSSKHGEDRAHHKGFGHRYYGLPFIIAEDDLGSEDFFDSDADINERRKQDVAVKETDLPTVEIDTPETAQPNGDTNVDLSDLMGDMDLDTM